MLSVAEALSRVLEQARAKLPAEVALAEAGGLMLAEDVASDVDSPPHDKSLVDGYAVCAADVVDGRAKLSLLEEITAGMVPSRKVMPGFCSRIMTGAPLPDGADAVVMVERTQAVGEFVEITGAPLRVGQNVMRRGKSLRHGEIVLQSGAELGPAEIGLLAEVGRARVQTIGPVRVAIVSTGNELVTADVKPTAGKIRNSNGPLLTAAVRRAGAVPDDLGIARDEPAELRRVLAAGLESDVLVISGGVSAGVLDLVPGMLAELGVRQVFHKIDLKPGKPLWFGVRERQDDAGRAAVGDGGADATETKKTVAVEATRAATSTMKAVHTLVFGVPGNPVSALVCFELFARPAIAKIAGRRGEVGHRTQQAKLTREFLQRSDRPTYYPGVVVASAEGLLAEPKAWQGSADLRGFAGANALLVFAAGEKTYAAGETVDVLML